jgi:hypothetical protein
LRITFALKGFFRDQASNTSQLNHFLLAEARVEVTLVFEDSTEKVFVPPKSPNGRFVLDIGPADVPESVAAPSPPLKKRISALFLDFRVPVSHGGRTFQTLRILQDFSLTPTPANSDQNIDYALAPLSWNHSAFALTNRRTSAARTANAGVHPLLDLTKLSQSLVLMNALVLDVTDLWDQLHETNGNYRVYKGLGDHDRVTFKVFAHLGGNAFIWYGIVPSYLSESTSVSPHVFFSPADYAEKQNERDEKKYLFNNAEHLEKFSGRTLIHGYLLPPVDDVRIPDLDNLPELDPTRLRLGMGAGELTGYQLPDVPLDASRLVREMHRRSKLIAWVIARRRNVVNFFYTSPRTKKIMPAHWDIGAGFERAFYALGKIKPQQFLLMPQPYGKTGVIKGRESDAHLKVVTDAIVDVLQTNTELVGHPDGELVAKDKMVLSCYSESGWDLWKACATNTDHIKAIIGIEPNSTNPKGRDIIPTLLAKQIRVFIIGRHQGFNDHYRPKVAKPLQDQIRFLPDKPREVLKYPPDPDLNDFVKYRVARVTKVDLDPLMTDHEKEILEDLAKRRKPITGKAAIPVIFQDINNSDKLSDGGLTSIFYTHNFALTGGQEMTLDDPPGANAPLPPDNFYNRPVTYRTFFQQAVEEIG